LEPSRLLPPGRASRAEFFDTGKYPAITFSSTKIEAVGTNALNLTGDLSVHGVTKSVVLDATINKINGGANTKMIAGFDAVVMLRRSDFGVSRYVPMTSDELSVHITLEAVEE
jgi:polyisoprenoid-binding protein YceI